MEYSRSRTFIFAIFACVAFVRPSIGNTTLDAKCEAALVSAAFTTSRLAARNLIAYLDSLLERRILSDESFRQFAAELEQGRLMNPISRDAALGSSSLSIHQQSLELHHAEIHAGELRHLKDWARGVLLRQSNERAEKKETSDTVKDTTQKIIFHQITPGSFQVELQPKRPAFKATISKEFWMMAHPVTQLQWAKVMGRNPAAFKHGPTTIRIYLNNDAIDLQPNHPIESVSRDEVLTKFLPRLNQMAKENDPLIYELIPDHRPGDDYRLPTEAEWAYVATNRGRWGAKSYFLSHAPRNLERHAIHAENSSQSTHPVGSLAPLLVDGDKPFYDLFGNVSEWTLDGYDREYPYSSDEIVDPVGKADGWNKVVSRGGSWSSEPGSISRIAIDGDFRLKDTGFRLVRTRK